MKLPGRTKALCLSLPLFCSSTMAAKRVIDLTQDDDVPVTKKKKMVIDLTEERFVVVSLNMDGNRELLYRNVLASVDVLCLQETKTTKEFAVDDFDHAQWNIFKNAKGRRDSNRGVATLSRQPLRCHQNFDTDLPSGRLVITECGRVTIVNIYGYTTGKASGRQIDLRAQQRPAFLNLVVSETAKLLEANKHVMIVGDFNDDVNKRNCTDVFTKLHRLGMVYASQDKGFTYSSISKYNGQRFYARVDYIMVSPGLKPCVTHCEVLRDDSVFVPIPDKKFKSYHLPLHCELNLSRLPP